MAAFLAGIAAKLISTPIIGAILQPVVNGLLTAQKQKLDAVGSHEARTVELAQKSLELDKREAEVNAQVIIAEQGNWMTRLVRPVWAIPFIAFSFKVVLWDKVIGSYVGCSGKGPKTGCESFVTDPLDPNMWGVFMAMVIAYYGGRSAEKVANKIAGVLKK